MLPQHCQLKINSPVGAWDGNGKSNPAVLYKEIALGIPDSRDCFYKILV